MTLLDRAAAAGLVRGERPGEWNFGNGEAAVWNQYSHGRWNWWASMGPGRRVETSHESAAAALRAVCERLEVSSADPA